MLFSTALLTRAAYQGIRYPRSLPWPQMLGSPGSLLWLISAESGALVAVALRIGWNASGAAACFRLGLSLPLLSPLLAKALGRSGR
jgi:hypothetical protein